MGYQTIAVSLPLISLFFPRTIVICIMLGYSGVVLVSLNLIMYGDEQVESVATIFEILFSSWALTVERLQLWPCFRLGFHYSRIILTTKEV